MSIESPATYGDEYFASQKEASLAFEEDLEKSIKGFIPNIFVDGDVRDSIPFGILDKLESLLAFPDPGLAAVGGRFISEIADEAVSMVMKPALRKTQYAANRAFANMIPTTAQASLLFTHKMIASTAFDYAYRAAGYSPEWQAILHRTFISPPSLPEWIRWARHHGEPKNAWGTLQNKLNIDTPFYAELEWLSQQVFTTDQITALFRRRELTESETVTGLGRIGWQEKDARQVMDLSFVIPNAMLLLQAGLFQESPDQKIFERLGEADIKEEFRQEYIDAVLTKPNPTDLIALNLRKDNNLADLETDLKKIGIHPAYLDTYKTLAFPIPPVSDLITMAVREAFSPATAARFGQYEDFPTAFADFARQQGLTDEWAKRYWAAHWSLPSPSQGYAMLQRGIIKEADLNMLLKALDIMPFWRSKLVQLAYNPLTRVDVRRMYELGVLSRGEVYKAYLERGYSPENAVRMTEFTVQQVLAKNAGLTTKETLRAYVDKFIDRKACIELLQLLGLGEPEAVYLTDTEIIVREWDLVKDRILGIKNLYKRQVYSINQARDELGKLGQPAEQIDALMEQWYFEKRSEPIVTFSKAELKRFHKKGLIDTDRARLEYVLMGYDEERVTIYMRELE